MDAPSSNKNAKTQFFFIYLFTLVLIFIVVSAFWKTAQPETVTTEIVNDDAARFMQIDTLLHSQLAGFNAEISRYRQSKNTDDLSQAQRKAYLLQQTIDSINKQAEILLDGPRKQFMQLAVGHFEALVKEQNAALYGQGNMGTGSSASVTSGSANASSQAEIQRLQQLLTQKEERIQALEQLSSASGQDKDKLIASLQNQLQQKEAALQQKSNAPSTNVAQESEWRQKYASLKTAFEKTAASEKALKAAFKTVTEDNRRLLNQLQSLRAEKKN